MLNEVPDILIRPMSENDVLEVIAVERASYQFPWSEGIFRVHLKISGEPIVKGK